MILVVNFNLVENAMLEKVSGDLGFGDRCQYLQTPVTTPRELIDEIDSEEKNLPRIVIINLDSSDADWQELLKNMKADEIWRFVPVLGFGFLENSEDVREFYALGGASCIRKPHGYDGLFQITKTAIGYWLDVSYMPCDFMSNSA